MSLKQCLTINLLFILLVAAFVASAENKTFHGLASWYNEGAGGPTASGVPFDPTRLEAAHKTLPFGTVVDVYRKDTDLKVRVVIVDRGPYVSGRIIDLTPAAAYRLDMVEAGVVSVKVEIVQIGRCKVYGCKFKRGEKI